jgi:hypothetical protein
MYLFFGKNQVRLCAQTAQRHAAGRIRTFSSVLSELFLCALPYFVPLQLLASSPLSQMTTYVRTPALVTPASFGNIPQSSVRAKPAASQSSPLSQMTAYLLEYQPW